jgi:hypothetical protein
LSAIRRRIGSASIATVIRRTRFVIRIVTVVGVVTVVAAHAVGSLVAAGDRCGESWNVAVAALMRAERGCKCVLLQPAELLMVKVNKKCYRGGLKKARPL